MLDSFYRKQGKARYKPQTRCTAETTLLQKCAHAQFRQHPFQKTLFEAAFASKNVPVRCPERAFHLLLALPHRLAVSAAPTSHIKR